MPTHASRSTGGSAGSNSPSRRAPTSGGSARQPAAKPAPAKQSTSARLTKQPEKPSEKKPSTSAYLAPTDVAPQAAAAPAAKPAASASARHAKPTSATGRMVKPTGTSAPRQVRKSGGSGIVKYVLLTVVVLALVGVFAYGPVSRSLALGKLDACKEPGKASEAIAAADAFLAVVDSRPGYVIPAIMANRGPVEAQIHLAKSVKLFASLVQIAERPLSDAPPTADGKPAATLDPRIPSVTQDQRTLALTTAFAVYDREKHSTELMPDDLAKWAKDGQLKRELSIAAVRLMAKANTKSANDTFLTIATEPSQDPLRIEAAIDAIAEIADTGNLGFAVGLLGSKVGDQAVTRTALTDKITRLASPDHLPRLVELMNNPKDAIRAIAIEAMGGPNMSLGDSPEHFRKREELGKAITPKLTPTTSPVELAAALKAVKGLRLTGARDAVLTLASQLKSLHLEGITEDFLADMLGRVFLATLPEAAVGPDGKKGEAQAIAELARNAGDDLISKLSLGLDNAGSRSVCAKSLALITDTNFLNLRASLDKLIEHGDDDTCFTALLTLVTKTYRRDDVSKACGKDLPKWKAFLAQDRPRFERFKELYDWMGKNSQSQLEKQNRAKITETREFHGKAKEEVDAWVADKAFVPPLGLTKVKVQTLSQDLNMMGKNLRDAWARASE